eukprot:jgi/Botrbrau1/9625/Bobra.0131s0005.1
MVVPLGCSKVCGSNKASGIFGLRSETRKHIPRRLIVESRSTKESVIDVVKKALNKDDDEVRFRWNPAQSRWESVTAARDKGGKYSLDKWEAGGVATIQPKSGAAYTVWPVIHANLTKAKLKSLPAQEVLDLYQKKGYVIVDVRPEYQYKKEHIEGAINIPLFRPVTGTGFWDNLKKGVMKFGLAMVATERDPDFREKATDILGKRAKVVVYCTRGGTIEVGVKPWAPDRTKSFKDDPERMFGIESRSLKGCYELLQAGYKDVIHLKGGLSQWRHDGFPCDGE